VREFDSVRKKTTGETDEFRVAGFEPQSGPRTTAEKDLSSTDIYASTESCGLNKNRKHRYWCVYGGSLTALRYREKEFVSVRARATYYDRSGRSGEEEEVTSTANVFSR